MFADGNLRQLARSRSCFRKMAKVLQRRTTAFKSWLSNAGRVQERLGKATEIIGKRNEEESCHSNGSRFGVLTVDLNPEALCKLVLSTNYLKIFKRLSESKVQKHNLATGIKFQQPHARSNVLPVSALRCVRSNWSSYRETR